MSKQINSRCGAASGRGVSLLELLMDAGDFAEREVEGILDGCGISVAQYRLLRSVEQYGTQQPKELVERRRLSAPAVSNTTDSLVRAGLLLRAEHTTDRRCQLVSLTEEGRALVKVIAAELDAASEKLVSLDGQDRFAERISELLKKQ